MPLFDPLAPGGERNAVVFDIGRAYTKCGFSGETGPRFIIPSVSKCKGDPQFALKSVHSTEDMKEFMVNFFFQLYYRNLLVNPKDRRVVIIESILSTTESREVIANVLFNHFEVPSILFAPVHLVSLFTVGAQTGLVLDCGYREAVVLPVYEGHPLLNAWQAAPLGGQAIHENLKELLLCNATVVDRSGQSRQLAECSDVSLSESMLEDLKVRACFVSPLDRSRAWTRWHLSANQGNDAAETVEPPNTAQTTFQYALSSSQGGRVLSVPSRVREAGVEVLFELDGEEVNLSTLLLDALLATPIDVRRTLATNIMLLGGTCQLPGLKSRIKEELDDFVQLPKYAALASLGGFKFHRAPAKENYTAWLGGAMFGALESLPVRSLSREAYLHRPKVPDWVSVLELAASADQQQAAEQSAVTRK